VDLAPHCEIAGQQTAKTVAIVLGGALALGFLVICLLFARSLVKKKDGESCFHFSTLIGRSRTVFQFSLNHCSKSFFLNKILLPNVCAPQITDGEAWRSKQKHWGMVCISIGVLDGCVLQGGEWDTEGIFLALLPLAM
jgi:hypothetical protein